MFTVNSIIGFIWLIVFENQLINKGHFPPVARTSRKLAASVFIQSQCSRVHFNDNKKSFDNLIFAVKTLFLLTERKMRNY